jgi:hypothetical protein
MYCGRASIAMINAYYGGTLLQDQISYYAFGSTYDRPYVSRKDRYGRVIMEPDPNIPGRSRIQLFPAPNPYGCGVGLSPRPNYLPDIFPPGFPNVVYYRLLAWSLGINDTDMETNVFVPDRGNLLAWNDIAGSIASYRPVMIGRELNNLLYDEKHPDDSADHLSCVFGVRSTRYRDALGVQRVYRRYLVLDPMGRTVAKPWEELKPGQIDYITRIGILEPGETILPYVSTLLKATPSYDAVKRMNPRVQ